VNSIIISGGGDITRSSENANVSGVALAILAEQDQRRMRRTITSTIRAKVQIASHILRLYKQFANLERVVRLVRGKDIEMFNFNANQITTDEVIYTQTKTETKGE